MKETKPHEQPKHDDRRRDRRIASPMTVVIGNTPYATENWSLGGMKIANYYSALQPPDQADVKVLVPTAGPGALFQTKARVHRYDPNDVSLSVAFEKLDILARATLNRYFQERVAYGQK